jgi:hypothetical protein
VLFNTVKEEAGIDNSNFKVLAKKAIHVWSKTPMKKFPLIFAIVTFLIIQQMESAVASGTTTIAAEDFASCAAGGVCNLGDIGPGGGQVFFVRTMETYLVWKMTPNTEGDFAFSSAGWKYLEVAPKTWSGKKNDPELKWCNNSNVRASWTKALQGRNWSYKWVPGVVQTGFLASTGFGNSEIISQNCTSGAATSARKYRGGGKSDWYLPRATELNQLVMFAGGILAPKSACCIKDFPKKQSSTFSSSRYALDWTSHYWVSSFTFGNLANQFQGQDHMGLGTNSPIDGLPLARPIRAF